MMDALVVLILIASALIIGVGVGGMLVAWYLGWEVEA